MLKFASLAVFLALVAGAALTGMKFQPGEWYAALNKPAFTPPSWVFPVAWTTLYIMIAFAGWFAWQAGGLGPAVAIWGVALIFNAVWSYLMFGQHEIGMALVDLILLWLAIVGFILATWSLAPKAAYLFMPYLAWVSFAGLLNYEIWRLNG